MTKLFMKWWADSPKTPLTPEEFEKIMLPMLEAMLEAVKADLSAGRFTEWGQFSNAREGYAITEASEEDLCATMLKYTTISYEVFPVLDADQSMEAVKKAAAAMQA